MVQISRSIKGVSKALAAVSKLDKKANAALISAMKRRAFLLRGELVKAIVSGAPGGRRFRPLTKLRRITAAGFSGRLAADRPYNMRTAWFQKSGGGHGQTSMARVIRYHVDRDAPDPILKVGWTGPQVSKSWKTLARVLQAGGTQTLSESARSYLRWRGGIIAGSRTRTGRASRMRGRASVFFLKKSTRSISIPARPVIDPFYKSVKNKLPRDIRRLFVLKMRGKNIYRSR